MNIAIDNISFSGYGNKFDVAHKNKVKIARAAAKKLGLAGKTADAYVKKEIIKLQRRTGHTLFN